MSNARHRTTLLLYCFLLVLLRKFVKSGHVDCKFKSLNCISYDKDVGDFPKCLIKAVSHDDNYITIHGRPKQAVYKAIVRVAVYKRANGWKPFLYDISFDGCKFLKNYKANPVAHFFYNTIADYVNLNHTCPYDHEVHLDKFRMSRENIPLPFPKGEYAVDTHWRINDKLLARVNGSCIMI